MSFARDWNDLCRALEGNLSQINLTLSYVDNPDLMTGYADSGTAAHVMILAHNRIYGDGTSVAVAGGSIGGLAQNTSYQVYYDDPALDGGTVTYQATTDRTLAFPTADRPNRVYVGGVRTPPAGGSPYLGGGKLPPGYIEG
jgi:hypothetical protein